MRHAIHMLCANAFGTHVGTLNGNRHAISRSGELCDPKSRPCLRRIFSRLDQRERTSGKCQSLARCVHLLCVVRVRLAMTYNGSMVRQHWLILVYRFPLWPFPCSAFLVFHYVFSIRKNVVFYFFVVLLGFLNDQWSSYRYHSLVNIITI